MIHQELKNLRKEHGLTLKALSTKVGYGTGNLSSYENGKLKPKDETIIRILTRGFGMTTTEAKAQIALWRKRELEEVYHIQLAQVSEPYNRKAKKQSLDDYLKTEGLNAKDIRKIKKEIQALKKRK